jgi:hypothetical protein
MVSMPCAPQLLACAVRNRDTLPVLMSKFLDELVVLRQAGPRGPAVMEF